MDENRGFCQIIRDAILADAIAFKCDRTCQGLAKSQSGSQKILTTMASTASNIVFDDIFTINAIDKEGKKFERGSLLALGIGFF
jgi:hypothetical protein